MPLARVQAQGAQPRFVKGICSTAFPKGVPNGDCFRMARNAGFDAIELRLEADGGEINLSSTLEQMNRLRDAAAAQRLQIASLWVLTLRPPSMVSPNPAVRAAAVALIKKGISLAPALNCDALLMAAGMLGSGAHFEVPHDEAWQRATDTYRQVLPLATQAKVMLTPENVWSKFLVSPRDMRSFIDQFHSPWVQAHFDIGNVMQWGYPQDWILTLGSRIKRVHLKDYKLATTAAQGRFVPLLEGDVEWPAVMKCLVKIGYAGFVSAEVPPDPSDPDYVMKVSRAVDKILAFV